MTNTYFKLIGQKSINGKMIIVAVVDEDMLGGDLPTIFECKHIKWLQVFTQVLTLKLNLIPKR